MSGSKSVKKFFGTDGIRGKAGVGKLSKDSIAQLGLALGRYVQSVSSNGSVVLGRDTRASGDWIEHLLVTGLLAHGITVKNAGVFPTAATSFLTAELGADLGIMITASHNPSHDNGLKLFGPDGTKFDNGTQKQIETLLSGTLELPAVYDGGKVIDVTDSHDRYIQTVLSSYPDSIDFSAMSVVLDCANGAGYQTGPEIFTAMNFKNLYVLGNQPNGTNINKDCGSTHPEALCEAVKHYCADIGIALDGDADRLIMCDENGAVINGDQSMGALALSWRADGRLTKPGLVATVMSNLGLERLMDAERLSLIRTAVGDRHVAAAMQKGGYNLGGEQSGHMLMPDFLPTGDGALAAVQVLSVLARSGKPASQTLKVFDPVPQLLVNVRYEGVSPLERTEIKEAIKSAEAEFGSSGRILTRASGTEPVIRVMTEGDDPQQVKDIAHRLADVIGG